jgi:hypothetical protein
MNQAVETLNQYLFGEEDAEACAVLDGASVPELLGRLDELQPEHECLYMGELKPDLAEVAPYLVRLEQGSEFSAWVVEQGWGNHWGIFALSQASLRELRRHFRTFLKVYDPNGKPLLFRYYDPRVMRVYLPTCNAEELKAIFGPVAGYLLEDEDPGVLLAFRFPSGQLVQQKKQLALRKED